MLRVSHGEGSVSLVFRIDVGEVMAAKALARGTLVTVPRVCEWVHDRSFKFVSLWSTPTKCAFSWIAVHVFSSTDGALWFEL